MTTEIPIHGVPEWQFPSPSSTPKTDHQPPFQTPKLDSSQHFADAWSTPQVAGSQTPARTPALHDLNTGVPRLSKQPYTPLTPDDPKFHINHFQKSQHLLPPVDPSHRLSSTPEIPPSNALQNSASATRLNPEDRMDGFQMHTPPPTRDSSSRREYGNQDGSQQTTATHYGIPNSTPGPIYPGSAAQLQSTLFQTPSQFTSYQFSPAMFQFSNPGPASAPAMPHTRLPWDQSPNVATFPHHPPPPPQHLYGVVNPISPTAPSWQSTQPSPIELQAGFQDHSAVMAQPGTSDFWMSDNVIPHAASSFGQPPFAPQATSSVDPSMIFSFSSQASTIDPSATLAPQPQDMDGSAARQPYEHQTRESIREREVARQIKQQTGRPMSSSGSAGLQGAGRPVLQRSNTDSGFRRSRVISEGSRPNSQIIEHIPRRASPLKRVSQVPLTAIPEAGKAKVRTRLVIDASGRATTVTEPTDETDGLNPTQSMSAWDDDDSSDEDLPVPSQRNSFIFDSSRPGKHSRVDSDEGGRLEAPKRPLSSASLASLTTRLQNTPIGQRTVDYRRISSGSMGGDFGSAERRRSQETSHDAAAALKRAIEGRKQRQEQTNPHALLRAHNQRWSQASYDVAKLGAFSQQQQHSNLYDQDVSTPTTDRSTRSTEGTRCICDSTESDGRLMVQCDSCYKWLHVRCVNLSPDNLPSVYVCVFCSGQGPSSIRRMGQREPARNFTSPLNYKSGGDVFR